MMHPWNEIQFKAMWAALQKEIHENAVEKGFWQDKLKVGGTETTWVKGSWTQLMFVAFRNSRLALVMTEIAEVIEACRVGNPVSEKIPPFSNAEEEMADAIIRLMDIAEGYGWNVIGAIFAKMEYNKTRERMHGKDS